MTAITTLVVRVPVTMWERTAGATTGGLLGLLGGFLTGWFVVVMMASAPVTVGSAVPPLAYIMGAVGLLGGAWAGWALSSFKPKGETVQSTGKFARVPRSRTKPTGASLGPRVTN